MSTKSLLITPPFTQLNTPYPATAYLKGYLNTLNVASFQVDLGLDVILSIFSSDGLKKIFETNIFQESWDWNIKKIHLQQDQYIKHIDAVIAFLQGKNDAYAYNVCQYGYLPQAKRFDEITDLEFAFGQIGLIDKAKYIATLFIEDIGDYITETIDEHFGFSRYAERLSRSAHTYDELYNQLNNQPSYIDKITLELIDDYIHNYETNLVVLSIPFPGNLYAGLRIGQHIKQNHPNITVAMGGGYVNTELRNVSDIRLFECIDYLSLDDGERPIECLINYLNNKISIHELKRTFALIDNKIEYLNGSLFPDVKQELVGTPDYRDLKLNDYISVIEVANPMHKLWSDGRWNKLTLAHGCYWGKCTFCDVHLDYIQNYEASSATLLVDKIETIIEQTGTTGFHFVDEAAPPSLMKQLAIELIKRKINITWWTNIRFEKSFTADLCRLLAKSGCIAVSGGLEVASDRLLALIKKGVTVQQVAQVTHHLTEAGIFVHAYLMYGFPTQTTQETIDSLEYVRQLFEQNILQSGYWHQFAMTAHSPIGKSPETFKVKALCDTNMPFANNDIPHLDPTGTQHEQFSAGLKKSLFNYMNGIGIDFPLQVWFDFPIPKTTIAPNAIEKFLSADQFVSLKPHHKLLWIGSSVYKENNIKKGKHHKKSSLYIINNIGIETLYFDDTDANFFEQFLPQINITLQKEPISFQSFSSLYEEKTQRNINLLIHHPEFNKLRTLGLLAI